MASNQLSDQDRTSVKQAIDQLFGRVIKHLPCPLRTMDERRDLHWCTLSETQLGALKELHALQDNIFYQRGSVKLCVFNRYLHMSRNDSEDQDGYFWGAPLHDDTDIPDAWVMSRVSKASEFMNWIQLARTLSEEIVVAHATFFELQKMCTTAGQLRRVLPELIDFMPPKVKLILGKQARASSTPFEWSAFDRDRVDQLTDTMAKCMLMRTDETNTKWSKRAEHTWPIVEPLHSEEEKASSR